MHRREAVTGEVADPGTARPEAAAALPAEALARRAAARLAWSFAIFILGKFLDEVLTLDLGPLYFRPEKVGLMAGTLIVLRYAWIPFRAPGASWFLLLLWGAYNAWWGASIFWNQDFGSLLNKGNVLVRHLAEFVITCGWAGAIIQSGGFASARKALLLFPALAGADLIAGVLDVIVGFRVIPSGVVERTDVYDLGMHGFHHERLFLAEFLILGSAFAMGRLGSGPGRILRMALVAATPVVIFLLASYTGILAYSLFLLFCFFRAVSWKGRIVLGLMGIAILVALPSLYDRIVPAEEKTRRETKLERRLEGDETTDGRVLASDYVLRSALENPSYVGNGYLSTEQVLSEIFGNNSTPHTIASIPYEQGMVGIAVFLAFALCWGFHAMRFAAREQKYARIPKEIRYCIMALACCTLMRVAFYYQVKNIFMYMASTACLSCLYLGAPRPEKRG